MTHTNGMHFWLMDELELGKRVAHCLDDENNAMMRLPLLSYEVEHWNCPRDDDEHERFHEQEKQWI